METQARASSPPLPPPPLQAGDDSASCNPFVVDSYGDLSFLSPDNVEERNCLEDCELTGEGSAYASVNYTVSSGAASQCHTLLDKIVRQVEYYFSDQNLPNDAFLLSQVRKNKEGYVPIALISSFKKMKKLTKDPSLIVAALRTSSLLAVSSGGKKVKRLHPLPVAGAWEVKSRTILVENLPEDYSEDGIRRIFATAGHIEEVIIRDPHSAEQSGTLTKADLAISGKLHALVQYDTLEAAESAILALNDEMNWRDGIRVQSLSKRMEKYGFLQKRWKCVSGKDGASALSHEGSEKKEEVSGGFKGGGRNRFKGRGMGNPLQPANEQGHDAGSKNTSSKPNDWPRMPDGTRGFTMGRGKLMTT